MGFSDLMKKWHKKYVEDEDEKTQFHHSTSYHNYFQGYSERKVLGDRGVGYSIQREYTAHYLAFTLDRGKWIRFKVLYAALYLASAALTLLALFSGARALRAGWVAVFGVLQLLALLLLLIPMGNYLAAPMKMRLGQYNLSAKRIGQYSIPAAILAGLFLLTAAVWYAVMTTAPEGADILALCFQAVSTAAIAALCITENRMKYRRIANDAADRTHYDENEIW